MLTVLALGPDRAGFDDAWRSSRRVASVVHLDSAAPSGKRFGTRILGVGLDAVRIVVKAVFTRKAQQPYLAMNPWTGVALALTGRRNVIVNGLYAAPGSNSWAVLRRFLRGYLIITTSDLEAQNWMREGGRAKAIEFGNTFQYPPSRSRTDGVLKIFIGGSSDRDPFMIEQLEDEVRASGGGVTLVVADGSPAREEAGDGWGIVRPGWLSQDQFGEMLSGCDVVFLPIRSGNRAAGHMVLVGALEVGLPVLISAADAASEYDAVSGVSRLDPHRKVLPQLRALGGLSDDQRSSIRREWEANYSLEAYVRNMLAAIPESDSARS
jgi:hypothetical protein